MGVEHRSLCWVVISANNLVAPPLVRDQLSSNSRSRAGIQVQPSRFQNSSRCDPPYRHQNSTSSMMLPRFLLFLGSSVPWVTPTSRTASLAISPRGLYAQLPNSVEWDRTRPPGVTQRTLPPRRPHTPCCVQMPQVFPSPP